MSIFWLIAFTMTADAAAEPLEGDFAAYRKQHSLTCVGPFDGIIQTSEVQLAGKPYRLSGSKLTITPSAKDADDEVRFGVLGSVKDFLPETKRNLDRLFDWFNQEKVEWVVLNGDIGGEEEEFEELVEYLAGFKKPLLVSIGNYESRGTYFRVISAAAEKYPWIIDQNLVRVIEADDVVLISMPGYYDRRFLHTGSGCLYKSEDIDATLDAVEKTPGPRLLISHGPPRGVGSRSIDVVADGRVNVGDPELTRLIREGAIEFGIFGHILESGGRAVGGDLTTPVAVETWSPKLYVNVGTANGLPWGLNDGTTVTGMGAVFTVKGNKAKTKFKIYRDAGAAPSIAASKVD